MNTPDPLLPLLAKNNATGRSVLAAFGSGVLVAYSWRGVTRTRWSGMIGAVVLAYCGLSGRSLTSALQQATAAASDELRTLSSDVSEAGTPVVAPPPLQENL